LEALSEVHNSMRTISFQWHLQRYTMKRRESHAQRVSPLVEFTWTIRGVIMRTRCLRNLPMEALIELPSHLIRRT
jgi:hypothetical protein